MDIRDRLIRTVALTLASVCLFAAPVGAQGSDVDYLRGVSPEVLEFSFIAPPAPQVTLRAWDGWLRPDGLNYVFGPVPVDWNRIDLDWRFIWQPTVSGVASVRWELSKYPFPATGTFVPSPGFGLVGYASSSPFIVDLNVLAPRPPNWTLKLAFDGLAGSFSSTGIVLPPTEIPPGKQLTRQGALNVRFAGAKIPASSNADARAYIAQADPVITQSMSLYMRVVPVNVDGVPIGPPSNVVVLGEHLHGWRRLPRVHPRHCVPVSRTDSRDGRDEYK